MLDRSEGASPVSSMVNIWPAGVLAYHCECCETSFSCHHLGEGLDSVFDHFDDEFVAFFRSKHFATGFSGQLYGVGDGLKREYVKIKYFIKVEWNSWCYASNNNNTEDIFYMFYFCKVVLTILVNDGHWRDWTEDQLCGHVDGGIVFSRIGCSVILVGWLCGHRRF